jgi:hypothetical protein
VGTIRSLSYAIAIAGTAATLWTGWHQVMVDQRNQARLATRISALEKAPRQVERIVERQTRIEVERDAVAVSFEGKNDSEIDASNEPAGNVPVDGLGLAAAYARRFDEESVDASWAREARGAYLPSIRKNLPISSQIASFECRSRFCDLEVIHQDVDTSNEFLRSLFAMNQNGELIKVTGGFRAAPPTPTPDGKLAYHVYIARPGTMLALEGPSESADEHGGD